MKACIFNIGTWHVHTEDTNVLVKLWNACQFTDLGVIENQSDKNTGKAALDSVKSARTPAPQNDGYKWINDGAGGWCTGMREQTQFNVELLELLSQKKADLTDVVIVGHSRGAVLSVRIAAWLFEKLPWVKCHLFLYDPVKRMLQGTDHYNREIHDNVKSIRVIAMEDQAEVDFKLLTIKKRGPSGRADIDQSAYTRLPGTHGTATQVTGFPIGKVGYMLALRWLKSLSIPLASDAPTRKDDLLKAYSEIPRRNSVTSSGKNMLRKVNDNSKSSGSKTVKVGGDRTALLDRKAGKNKFMGTSIFVNEEHCTLFTKVYPHLGKFLVESHEYFYPSPDTHQQNLISVKNELLSLKAKDIDTYNYLMGEIPMLQGV